MSSVVKYNVGAIRAKASSVSTGAGAVAIVTTGAQGLMVIASIMTFLVDNYSMPYGIALTHYVTAAIMALSYLVYILGKDTTVEGEFSVKATTLYHQLSETHQISARPILDKIYEIEAKNPNPSLELQNAMLKRCDIIEKMVDAERFAEETKVIEDKSDTFTAVEWLAMTPQRPALEAGPSAKKDEPDHDKYGFPNYSKYTSRTANRAHKVYEGEVF